MVVEVTVISTTQYPLIIQILKDSLRTDDISVRQEYLSDIWEECSAEQ